MKHDRYIEFSNVLINIRAGLDILGEEEKIREQKECDIIVQRIENERRLSKPEILEKLR